MKPIDGCAEKRIQSLGSKTIVGTASCADPAIYSLPRRLRQIVSREAKFSAQFSVKIFESGSQFGFDSFARLRFLQLWKT
jgi:hypothetical protein